MYTPTVALPPPAETSVIVVEPAVVLTLKP